MNTSLVRVVGVCVLSIFVNFSYAIARPSIESLFTKTYGAKMYPIAWLFVGLSVALFVTLYTRLVARRTLHATYAISACVAAALLVVIMGARTLEVPGATFVLYLWKEVYIVILLEGLWTFANSVFKTSAARWVYGLFCVVGSVTATLGGFSLKPLADAVGTERIPWLLLPVLACCALTPLVIARLGGAADVAKKMSGDFLAGFRVVKRSRYLVFMLVLILVVQLVVTLVDYEYQVMLEQLHPNDEDARTAVGGQVYGFIDGIALVLQGLSGVFLSLFGVGKVLVSVPCMIALSLGVFLVFPRFLTMAVTKVLSKALDYSLNRAGKELLYIPLSDAEKRQGKAVIDMLGYRFAKVLVSALLLSLEALGFALSAVTVAALSLVSAWIALTVVIVRRYRDVVQSSSAPMSGADK